MTFHIGQRVVVIADFVRRSLGEKRGVTFPVVGQVYTVRGFNPSHCPNPGIYLEEIINAGGINEPAWWVERFRPVEDHRFDLSVFEAMLTRERKTEFDLSKLEAICRRKKRKSKRALA